MSNARQPLSCRALRDARKLAFLRRFPILERRRGRCFFEPEKRKRAQDDLQQRDDHHDAELAQPILNTDTGTARLISHETGILTPNAPAIPCHITNVVRPQPLK